MDNSSTTNNSTAPAPAKSKFGGMLKGNIYMLMATIFFGLNIPIVKFLIPKWMNAVDVTIVRMFAGCALMWITSIFIKNKAIARSDWWRVIIGGGIGLFSFVYFLNLSLRYANPIDVSIILTLPPVFVVLFNIVFRHYRPSLLETLGIVISFVGAAVVIVVKGSGHAGSDEFLGDLIALGSIVCYAFYLIVMEKPSHTYPAVSLLRWVFLAASVPALFFVGELGQAPIFHHFEWTPVLYTAYVGVCTTYLAYLFVQPAIKLIGSELVALYQYLVPAVAIVGSFVMGVGRLNMVQIIAIVVIIAGMVLTNRAKRHAKS